VTVPATTGTIRYRVYLPIAEGYLESWSGTQTVRRR
jgi:hypothetical protein